MMGLKMTLSQLKQMNHSGHVFKKKKDKHIIDFGKTSIKSDSASQI